MPAIGTRPNTSARAERVVRRKPKKPRFTLPPGPRGDSPSTRKPDMKKAKRFKKTKRYQSAIRASYRNSSEKRRAQRLERIARKIKTRQRLSREDRAVLKTYFRRLARDKAAMRSQVFNDRQRRLVEKYKATPKYAEALDEAQARRVARTEGVEDWRLASKNPKHMKAAGLTPDIGTKISNKIVATGLGPYTSAGAVVEGAIKDPGKVISKTAKSLPMALAALPVATVEMVRHPVQTGEMIAESLATPYDEKVKRVQEAGALEDLGNAAIGIGPTSTGVGRFVAQRSPARAARLLSGGVTKTPKTRGVVRYVGGRAVDAAKARRYERLAVKGNLSALQREALLKNRAAGRTVAVVPALSKRAVKLHGVARPRGRGVFALKYDISHGDIAKVQRELMRLRKGRERKALWFATELGIRTPEVAKRELPALRAQMLELRGDAKLLGREKALDVAALIDDVLKTPEKHFTKRLDEVLENIRPYIERITDDEPQFSKMTKEMRRRRAQEFLLDLEQGVIPEASALAREIDNLPEIKHGDPALTVREYGKRPSDAAWDPQAVEHYPAGYAGTRFRSPEPPTARTKYELNMRPDLERPATVPGLRYADEADADYMARIDAAAQERGLAEPMYFKSEKQRAGQADYAAMAVGGGKAKSVGRPFEGTNLERGIFDTSQEQFVRGYMQNVKAGHNYDLVNQIVERNRLESLSPEPQGTTVGELLNRINRAEPELQPESVALYNPGIFKKHLDVDADVEMGKYATPEEGMDAAAQQALGKATRSPREIDAMMKAAEAGDQEAILMMRSPGWHAIPKEALRELEAELTASTPYGRAADILKGNLSKAILLTGNLPWLGFQIVSESAVAAAATKGRALNPANIAGTARWWRSMTHEQRRQVGAAMGLGASGADSHVVRMGAATHAGFANVYRAFKAADFWHRPRVAGQPIATIISPVKWMRAADIGKTNVLRKLTAHAELSKLRRPALEATADSMVGVAKHDKAVTKLLPLLKKPAKEQLDYIAKHPEVLENVADTLVDYLGDWTTMTAAERKIVNRAVMFYPYVRYSTRLVLYTMPVDHPAVTAVLAELGQLQAEEYREIFGDDNLPWNIGKVFFGEDGEMTAIDLKRAHPGMNALMDIAANDMALNRVPGIAPPWFQWAFDQIAHRSTFADREWRVGGKAAPYGKKGQDYSWADRLRIAADDTFSLIYGYRLAKERTQEGVQGDDSLLFSDRPLTFAAPTSELDKAVVSSAKKQQAFEEENESLGGALLGPLYPTPSRDIARAREQRYIRHLSKQKGRKAPKNPFGGGSKPNPFGGSNSTNPFK